MFVGNVFETVKARADIITVAEHFSIYINSKGFARCPFHKEKTASMSISKAKQIYKCFGCNKGGDVINLVQDILNCTPYEAAKRINDICGCGLDFTKDNSKASFEYQKEYAKFKSDKKKVDKFTLLKQKTYDELFGLACLVYRYWNDLYIHSRIFELEYMSDEIYIIYKNKEYFEYIVDLFENDIDFIYNIKNNLIDILKRGIIYMDFEKIALIAFKEEKMPENSTNVELVTYYMLKELYIKHYKKQINDEQGQEEKRRIKSYYDKNTALEKFDRDLNKRVADNILKGSHNVTELGKMMKEKRPEKELLNVAMECIANLTDNPLFFQSYKENY